MSKPARSLRVEALLCLISNSWQRLSPRQFYVLLGVFAVLFVSIAKNLTLSKELTVFYKPPAERLEIDRRILQVQPEVAQNYYLILEASSIDQLLDQMHDLTPRLEKLREQGLVADYLSLSQWVPDGRDLKARERDYLNLLRSTVGRNYLQSLGVDAPPIETGIPDANLGEEWLRALPELVRLSLFMGLDDGRCIGVVRFLGLSDSTRVSQAVAQWHLPIVEVNNVANLLAGLNVQTQQALIGLLMAFVLAFCVLLVCYRNHMALVLIAVPFISCVFTLAIIAMFGTLSLFHLLALFLALGLGVDYAILFSHGAHFPAGVSAEIVSLAAVGNALSFGLLALSSLPMLAAFGSAITLCLIGNFVLAPVVVRWVRVS